MVYITAIHLEGGVDHQHISHVRYRESTSSATRDITRAEMVTWIRDKGGDARVASNGTEVKVVVVAANPPYLRTEANGRLSDNLLSLPRF
jgi:hypothetical protein